MSSAALISQLSVVSASMALGAEPAVVSQTIQRGSTCDIGDGTRPFKADASGLQGILSRVQSILDEEEKKLRDLELELGTAQHVQEMAKNKNYRKSIIGYLFNSWVNSFAPGDLEKTLAELNDRLDRLAACVDVVALSVGGATEKGADVEVEVDAMKKLKQLGKQARHLTKRLDRNMERCDRLVKLLGKRC
jgi:chromosome segregation ATPase